MSEPETWNLKPGTRKRRSQRSLPTKSGGRGGTCRSLPPKSGGRGGRALAACLDASAVMDAVGLPPDPWQQDLLGTEARQLLLLCSRQAGKSTVTSALALGHALRSPGSLVLMLAPSWRQSQELFRKLAGFYNRLGRPVPAESETGQHLELQNGSRVISLPGQEETIRGFSGVSLLIVDEAARVPDDLYFAVRPMLAVSDGRIIGLSTPYGKRGWFYEEWAGGGDAWEHIQVPASRCPRIKESFLKRERDSMSPRWFAQEYECEFTDRLDQVFASEFIEKLLDDTIEPIFI